MKIYRADLHVHTVLSPCASVEMIPPLIIQAAIGKGINLLAITDHNQTANIESVIQAAEGSGVTILPGMELQTREEIHLLCIFDQIEDAHTLQSSVDTALPAFMNTPEHFGEQYIVDATGGYIRSEVRLLQSSVNFNLKDAVDLVHKLGGLAIPAHIDRRAYGMLSVLGLCPPDIHFDALEISRFAKPMTIQGMLSQTPEIPIVQNGDVHQLVDMLGDCLFSVEHATIEEIKKAFNHIDGRQFRIDKDIDK